MASTKKTAIMVTVFSVVTRVLSFSFKIFLSRSLGAESLGLFGVAVAFFGFLTMFSGSGLPLTISRKVAESKFLLDKNAEYSLVTSGIIIALAVNAVCVIGFLALKTQILTILSDARAEKLIMIMIPATFSTCIYNVIRAYFMGKKRYVAYSTTELIEEILNVLIILVVMFLFVEVDKNLALPIAFTIADVICFLIIVGFYFAYKGKIKKPTGFKDILTGSVPITAIRILTAITTLLTAVLLPNRLVTFGLTPEEATAEFGRATGMAYPLLFAPIAITSSLSIVLLPEIAERNAKEDLSGIARKLDKSLTVAFIISAFFFVVYSSLGKQIGEFLFDDAKAGIFTAISSAMVIPLTLSQITTTTLNSIKKERTSFIVNFISLAIMILGLYFLPKYVGIYALAISQTAFHALSFLISTIFLAKYKTTKLEFLKPVLKISALSIILAVTLKLLSNLLSELNSFYVLLICAPVAAIGYGLILLVTGASKEIYVFKRNKFSAISKKT
ncbi:MAG: oligosaccharide flippase family protein [Clostridia bacterium]|nr:oligosaccharide flippase family protein [Clostridia bacterium]